MRSTPQFHTDSLSLTQGPRLISTQDPSVQHRKPLSSTPKSLSSTQKTPLFNTQTPSVSHQNPLSVTSKTLQFHTPLSSTPKTPQFHTPQAKTEGFLVLNCGVFGFELRGFWCGTEEFWGLKRSGSFVWN